MAAKAISYAEHNLGVHAVYAEAQATAQHLAELRRTATNLRAERRLKEETLTDCSFDLLSDLRAKHPEESQASIERKHKELVHTDLSCKSIRRDIRDAQDALDVVETDISIAKTGIEIINARMQELGGYFAYLAAVKFAVSGTENWPPDYRPGASAPQEPATPAQPAQSETSSATSA